MKYTVIFDEGPDSKLQRSDFECEDNNRTAQILAMSTYDDQPGLYTLYKELKQIGQFRINPPHEELGEEQKHDFMEKMKAILRSHGIRMKIGGCSCCDSPWIKFEYQGEQILELDGQSIDMFEESTEHTLA